MDRRTQRSVFEHEGNRGFQIELVAWTNLRLPGLNLFAKSVPVSVVLLMHPRDTDFMRCTRAFFDCSFTFCSSGNVVFGSDMTRPISTLQISIEISPRAWREAFWSNEVSSSWFCRLARPIVGSS